MCWLNYHSSILVPPPPLSSIHQASCAIDFWYLLKNTFRMSVAWGYKRFWVCRTGTRREISVIDFSFVNQMCLTDEEPICGICKLFGDHKSHPVAKISDAYAERKVKFATDIQLVLKKSESTAQAMQVWLIWLMSFLQQQGNVWLPFKRFAVLLRTLHWQKQYLSKRFL